MENLTRLTFEVEGLEQDDIEYVEGDPPRINLHLSDGRVISGAIIGYDFVPGA